MIKMIISSNNNHRRCCGGTIAKKCESWHFWLNSICSRLRAEQSDLQFASVVRETTQFNIVNAFCVSISDFLHLFVTPRRNTEETETEEEVVQVRRTNKSNRTTTGQHIKSASNWTEGGGDRIETGCARSAINQLRVAPRDTQSNTLFVQAPLSLQVLLLVTLSQ